MGGVASTYVVESGLMTLRTETDGQNFSSKRHLMAAGSDIMFVRHGADLSDPQIFVG